MASCGSLWGVTILGFDRSRKQSGRGCRPRLLMILKIGIASWFGSSTEAAARCRETCTRLNTNRLIVLSSFYAQHGRAKLLSSVVHGDASHLSDRSRGHVFHSNEFWAS